MSNTNKILPKLFKVIDEAWKRNYYKRMWRDLETIKKHVKNNEFNKIPLIRKRDIANCLGDLIEYGDFVDIVSSSGTTGNPVHFPLHRKQEKLWIDRVKRVLVELGVKEKSRVLILFSLNDLFTLGLLAWQAVKDIGGGSIRCSPEKVNTIIEILKYHQPKFVIGNPAVMLKIAGSTDWLVDDLITPDYAYFGACAAFDENNMPTNVAKKVKQLWHLKDTLNGYGCSEFGSIAHECKEHAGFHIYDDICYLELIDPETRKPAHKGEPGEVVITGLTLPRGFIPIRYATGDIASWLDESPCRCGRTSPRLGAIIGRVDYQIRSYGQTIYPDLLLNLVDKISEVKNSAIILYGKNTQEQKITLVIVPYDPSKQKFLEKRIAEAISGFISVLPDIQFYTMEQLSLLEKRCTRNTNGVKVSRVYKIEKTL